MEQRKIKREHSHQHDQRARIEENKELTRINNEHNRRKKEARQRHKQSTRNSLFLAIIGRIRLFFNKKNNEIEKQKKTKEKQIRNHIRRKRWSLIKKQIIDIFLHPMGTEEQKQIRAEKRKHKRLTKKLNAKIKEIKLKEFKQNISDNINAFKNRDVRKKLLSVFVSSVILFVLAYLTIFAVGNIITSLISSFWNIETTINASIIIYKPSPYSPLWSRGSVVSIFSAQFFVAFIISFFALWLFFKSSKKSYLVKMYLLWLLLVGQGLAWGSFFGAVIRKQGIYHALSWGLYQTWFSSKTIMIIMIIVGFIALLVFGNIIKRIYFYASPSATLLKKSFRPIYYHFLITLPFFIGLGIIAAINAPVYNLYTFIQLLSMFIMFLPLYMFRDNEYSDIGQFKIVKSKFNLGVIIGFFTLIVLIYKVLFNYGINF